MNQRFFAASEQYAVWDAFVPAPYLRHVFTVGDVRCASACVCAPGFYELFVNGRRITRGPLSPCIANPDEHLYYDVYDMRPYLKPGKNVIGLILGNGILNAVGGGIWDFDKAAYRSAPKAAFEFQAQDETGKIGFDASSFVCTSSPTIFDDLRCGEWYDAGKEKTGWMDPDYDDSAWAPVIPAETPRGELLENRMPPIGVIRERSPVSVRRGKIGIYPKVSAPVPAGDIPEEDRNGGWLYDFGLNAAGVCRLHIRNTQPGQKIILQFGEILGELREDGITTDRGDDKGLDLRGVHYLPHRFNQRDVYICRGAEEEIWEPYFTYHGFRYVLVFGLTDAQAEETLLTYRVMTSLTDTRSDFRCSDETANRVWDAALNADRSNFLHIPTDCPHREKNGWTGDAYASAEQLLSAFTCEEHMKQWLSDIRSAMREDGDIPGIIPTNGWGYDLGPVWASVITEIPYQIWKQRGDTSVLRENAHAVLRFLDRIEASRDERGLIPFGLGDWCESARTSVDDPKAPAEYTSTVIAMDSCRKAAEMFEALGKTPQRTMAQSLYRDLRASVRRELTDLGTVTAVYRCQTAQAMAVYYGVFDPAERPAAVRNLVDIIHENKDFIDCGVLGLRVIFRVLSDYGYEDLAYRMAMRSEFPSYGHMIGHGATALHELFFPMESVQSSCNHHFWGDISAWMLSCISGIRYADKKLVIAPHFISGLNEVRGETRIPEGRVFVCWKRGENCIRLTVRIPENVSAVLNLPAGWQTDRGFTRQYPENTENEYLLIPSTRHDICSFLASNEERKALL